MYEVHDFWPSVGNVQTADSTTKLGLGTFTLIHHLICFKYGTALASTQFITNLNSFWNYMYYKRTSCNSKGPRYNPLEGI